MKLIKIGTSQACDLRLDSDYVSSLHAEITILDDGQIILEDKNSRNGTKVGNKRIEPGKEVTIQRGDLVTFADTNLVWARIPMAENLNNYRAVYNIGSNYRNDIILNSQTVSRFHASLRIGKDGKAYIRDNNSCNGTMVNGVKIASNKDERIKKGDNVICGTDDITDQISSLIPQKPLGKIIGICSGIAVAVAILLTLFLAKPWVSSESEISPENFRTSVVYVRTIFHPIVTFEDNPMEGSWDGTLEFNDMQMVSQGTAFFLDTLGRMATNRHIATPWNELDINQKESLQEYIEANLPQGGSARDINNFLQTSIFSETVLNYARKRAGNNSSKFIKTVIFITNKLRKSNYTLSGKIDHMTVGYPGNYYTHADEFQRCNVLTVSEEKDIDLAILQLNNKKTPKEVKRVFCPSNFSTDKLEPLKVQLYTIGYPAGIQWGQDDKTKSLEPNIRETKCSKEPGKFDFEIQASSVAGSSGSPVFNDKGQLVGILWGGYSIAGGSTKAIHAKFLKKMYDEETSI